MCGCAIQSQSLGVRIKLERSLYCFRPVLQTRHNITIIGLGCGFLLLDRMDLSTEHITVKSLSLDYE